MPLTPVGRAALVLLASALSACATLAHQPWVLDSHAVPARPSRSLETIADYPEALATALDILERDLRLPRLQARLVFLPDDRTFEALLLQIGYTPQLARDAAGTMTAIGGHRTVLINQGRLERSDWPRRVMTVAHELGHVLQYELGGGGRGRSAQWLREGFAEWVALRTMETLGRVDGRQVRRQALVRVRVHAEGRFPRLAALASFPDWVAASRSPGGDALYDFALLAVSRLLEQHGAGAVIDYFSRFAIRQEPDANFREAFGQAEEEFERGLRADVWPRRP